MSIQPLKWLLLGPVLALLLLGHGFADNLDYGSGRHWRVPEGQPTQMSCRVDCDPKLTDPFFESDEWIYPDYIHRHHDDGFVDIRTQKRLKEPPRLKYTAMCVSARFPGSKNLVRFSESRILDANTIVLFIGQWTASSHDALLIRIRNGMFSCQYWSRFFLTRPMVDGEIIWTTTGQNLTLDKKVYRKGDVLKGRIDFKCRQEPTDSKAVGEFGYRGTVKVSGVFKAIVE